MKSTTCHKQTTTSLTLIPSDAAGHHRHHHSQYRNNSVSSRGSSIKPKPSDANNNDNSSMITMTTTATATTTKMPIMTAATRSKNNEKYSLRQRQKRSFAVPSSAAATMSASFKSTETKNNPVTASSGGRSNYSSTAKRSNTSAVASSSAFKEKAKNKAAPLSKYRRKTANARERTRMREINSAFENLRRCVPHTITGDEAASSNEKLTKITTLRLAMKYIRVLSQALDNPSFQEDFLLECQNDGDHRFSTRDWVQPIEVAVPSEEETQPAPTGTTTQPRPKARKTKLQTTKASTKRQRTKTKLQDAASPYLTSSSTFSSSFSSSSSSAYASMSASPLLDDCNSMTDLSNMMLESDGESLHLSEPCLSPLNRNYHLGMQSLNGTGGLIKNTPMAISIENPLELSLRLLQPDSDSLDFSNNQQPPTCISPLATLESFNPFGDLLHTEFPENSALDLFLT